MAKRALWALAAGLVIGGAAGACATYTAMQWDTMAADFNRGREQARGVRTPAAPVAPGAPAAPAPAPQAAAKAPPHATATQVAAAPAPAPRMLPRECHDTEVSSTVRYMLARRLIQSSAGGFMYAQGQGLVTTSDQLAPMLEQRRGDVVPAITLDNVVQEQESQEARRRVCKARVGKAKGGASDRPSGASLEVLA
jgi:hypothetical protein